MRSLLLLCLALSACGTLSRHKEHDTVQDLSGVKAERDIRVARIDPLKFERCDRLTFVGMFDAYGRRVEDLYAYEREPGRWERDVLPCYPDRVKPFTLSKSSISPEGMFSSWHALRARNDHDGFVRIHDYGEDHTWRMGDGQEDLVSALPYVPLIHKLADRPLMRETTMTETEKRDFLHGFRPHVLALFLWLKGKVYGGLDDIEMTALRKVKEANDASPLFHALYHRFKDGDQTAALERMVNIGTGDAPFGWGSATGDIYYVLTTAILEGR